ncbi:MAG: daunorubicin ABC transporter ATP-binding protein [Actinobacteria bacterium TMED172]|nr:MAG: daunorubicin ABC transporter ATP-binding protein [Actinobacteria bacterium TMED172]|tara:strand:- start:2731 stop:3684 length:954 start_codon:yes stop_codon:yes gene_type:complete
MSNLAIETLGLGRSFGSNIAVGGVDIAVRKGEIYGFLGPNGAGKSTTVRMLCTLLRPTSGVAKVAGFDVMDTPEKVRLRIGVAMQDAALDDKQSGREILEFQGRLFGLDTKTRRERVEKAIHLADIGDAIDDWVRTYSGGMKRRLDLAASLVHDPQVLFLDEPTTGLDPISRVRVWEEVRRLNRENGVTVFLTTQYLEEADELADRVGIIDRGRIVEEGTPTELKRAVGSDLIVVELSGDIERAAEIARSMSDVSEVTVGSNGLAISTNDAAALISKVAVAFNQHGISANSLTIRTPSLDDVFLRATGHRLSTESVQ